MERECRDQYDDEVDHPYTATEPTHSHIEGRPRKCPGKTIHQLSAHAEIAQLDLPRLGDQDVAGLDIPMNNPPLVQVVQPAQDGLGDLAQDLFARPPSSAGDLADERVERAGFAEFHQDPDTRIRTGQERAVVLDDVRRLTFVEELQLSQELFVNGRIGRGRDNLPRVI